MIETTRIGAGGWSCALAALLWTVALPAGAQPPTRPPSAPVDRGEQQPPSQGDEEPPSAEDPPAEEPPAAAEAPGEVSPAGDPSVEGDPAAEGTSGIEGRLVDSATQEGLQGAPVIARGRGEGQTYSTLTEQYGQFRLALPPGRYT